MKILSFNTRSFPYPTLWSRRGESERIDRIIKGIREQNADVVCLQEVYDEKAVDAIVRAFGTEYRAFQDGRPIETKYITFFCAFVVAIFLLAMSIPLYWIGWFHAMPLMAFGGCGYIYSVHSNCKGRITGLMTLVKLTANPGNFETWPFYVQCSDYTGLTDPAFSVVKVDKVSIINVSLTTSEKNYYRYKQAIQLAHFAQEVDSTVVVCGGFYDGIDSVATRALTENGFRDVMSGHQARDTWCRWRSLDRVPMYKGNEDCVDYIFVSPSDKTCVAKRVFVSLEPPYISDHFGLVAIVAENPLEAIQANLPAFWKGQERVR